MLYKKFLLAVLIVGLWSAVIFLISSNSGSIIDPIYAWAVITQIAGLVCGILLIILRFSKVISATSFVYILFAVLNLSVWIYFLADAMRPDHHYAFWYSFFPTMVVSVLMIGDIAKNSMSKKLK